MPTHVGLVPAEADTDGTIEPDPRPEMPALRLPPIPAECAEAIANNQCPVLAALAFESGRRRQIGEIIRRRAACQVG